MTTTPLPQPFGWLCEWRQPVGEENTQIFYYGEPGSAIEDDWSRTPDVHKNLPLFTVEQLHQARADLEAEVVRLRAQMQTIKDYAGNPEIVWKTAVAALESKP